MLELFIIKAIIAGCGIALISGPIGSLVVWRKMAYFGDSLAHSSLLGVSLGLVMGINLNFSIVLTSMGFALLIIFLQQKRLLAVDTLLGISSHAALSIGLVSISFMSGVRVDTYNFLFGDILTVSNSDIFWVISVVLAVLIALYFIWQPLVITTISEDIAKAEGIRTNILNIILMLLIALVIGISSRILGVLLITSLMIIPAASARIVSTSPKQMAFFASILGMASVIAGVCFSYHFDSPSGPTIIVTATAIFLFMMLANSIKKYLA